MAGSVILNVGGKLYQTEESTLNKYPKSIFPRLLTARNQDGHCVLDRDGKVFRHVLNFMRCGKLVLPGGFSEHDLLLCEAEFFNLVGLQEAIQEETRGGIGLRVGGRTFRMTTKEATHEKDSFFDKMLVGGKSVPRDAVGNYLVDRDASMFRYVQRYLREGGLFMNISSPEFDQLKKEGEYFGLNMLVHHVESIRFMRRSSMESLKLDLFYHDDSDKCIIYANKTKSEGWLSSWNISEVCSKHVVFKHDILGLNLASIWRFVGLLDVSKTLGICPTKEGIITLICNKIGAKGKPTEVQLGNGWTKLQFTT